MLTRIISGGQTGADRAALEAARSCGLELGGWVPKGRRAEDGRVPDVFGELRETDSVDPAERTRRNVAESDATLLLSHGALRGGSALTREEAARLGKPCLWIDLQQTPLETAIELVLGWCKQYRVGVLNVAGPRASEDERIYASTLALLLAVLTSPRLARGAERP